MSDKPQPNSREAEQGVLGGILIDNRALPLVIEQLGGGDADFYVEAHQKIYRGMVRLSRNGQPIDMITLAEVLKEAGELEAVGGNSYLAGLIDATPTTANVEDHARIVAEKATVRRAIYAAQEIMAQGMGDHGNVQEYLAAGEKRFSSLATQLGAATNLDTVAPTAAELYGPDQLRADLDRHPLSLATLPTSDFDHGWGPDLDKLLGGILPGYVLAVGAKSAGAGKTSFVMQLADGLALRSARLSGQTGGAAGAALTPVIVASEMSPGELAQRTLARWEKIDSSLIRKGDPNVHDQVLTAMEQLHEPRRWQRIVDLSRVPNDPSQVVDALARVAKQWGEQLQQDSQRPIWPVVILDPVQRLQGTGSEIEAQNALAESMALIAKRDGLILFVTSDTNKSTAGGREQGTPMEQATAAFRGSYKLLHAVDSALFLQRTDKYDGTGEPEPRPEVKAVIVKNRWGKCGPFPLFDFELANGRWTSAGVAKDTGDDTSKPRARGDLEELQKRKRP